MLDQIVKGQRIRPPRVVIHGEQKIGKSTFAAGAPAPIFIQTEDGADDIGVDRFPLALTFSDVTKALDSLLAGGHEYETVVIDSGDWLERLIHAKVAKEAGVKGVEDVPYGRGYKSALQDWRTILTKLDELRALGMAVVIINHTQVKRYDSPETEPYDRQQLKLHDSASALIVEWCDCVGFATKDVYVKETDVGFNKKHARGASNGKRVLRLEGAPAYVAGSRYGLPASIELSWQSFMEAFSKARIIKQETTST